MKNKEKIQIIVTSLLGVILLILIINIFMDKNNNGRPVIVPIALTEQSSKSDIYARLEQEAEGLSVERDPFSRYVAAVSSDDVSALLLIGIVWEAGSPAAVINDKVLKIGSTIDGYTVLDIQRKYVVLSDGTNPFELYLDNPTLATPAAENILPTENK